MIVLPRASSQSGFSLGSLFLLTAACAAILAMVAPVIGTHTDPEKGLFGVLIAAFVGGCVCGTIGLVLGLFHFNRLQGILWGGIVGGISGLFLGPLIFVPVDRLLWLFGTSVVGAAAILAVAVVIGRKSGRSPGAEESLDGIITATLIVPKRHPLDPDPDDD